MNEQFQNLANVTHELDEIRFKLFDIVNSFIEEKDVSEIFHYTSAEGLRGILDSQTLWFTRWDSLNDYSENLLIHELIEKNLEFFPAEAEFIELIRLLNDNKKKAKECILRKNRQDNLYIASFSLERDLLNMWREYTKSTKSDGYCIGFDYKELFNIKGLDMIISPVIYDEQTKKDLISKLLTLLHKAYQVASKNKDTLMQRKKIIGGFFCDNISDISCFFKHHAFKAEKEFRAVVRMHPYSNKHIQLEKLTRVSNGIIIPYTRIGFKKEVIKNISISPTLKHTNAHLGLDFLLQANNMQAAIHQSKLPFRNI